MKNSILKSISVTEVEDDRALLTVEPYDEAFSVEKAISVIKRRKRAIFSTLGVNVLTVEIYNENCYECGLTVVSEDVK